MPPQYTYEGTKSPSHFASKTNIVPFFYILPFTSTKSPEPPNLSKARKNILFEEIF